MNFLAHVFLAGDDPALQAGGVLGDFCTPAEAAALPAAVRAGIDLHRRIDAFTDRHAVTRRSCARVSATRRRFAGILVDVFYDHHLAVHWPH